VKKQVRISHIEANQNKLNSNALVVDSKMFSKVIQPIIGSIALILVIADLYLLNKYKQARFSRRSWIYLKIFGQIVFSYWNWIFVIASILLVNLLTIFLVLYDLRQLHNNGDRVNKSLLFFLVLCGGWITIPYVIFFTEYPQLNGYEIKKSSIVLVKLTVLSVLFIGTLIFLIFSY
jgi:hypothetical protein